MEGSVQTAEPKAGQVKSKVGLEPSSGGALLKKVSDGEDDSTRCFVDSGVLVTFPASTSKQRQEDVLNSLLFAQLAADKEYNRLDDPLNWFSYFEYILRNVGWVLTNLKFQIDPGEDYFVFSSLALNQMIKNGSETKDVETFRKIFNILHSLPDTDPSIEILYRNTFNETSQASSLILSSFEETEDKGVQLKLIMIGFEGVDEELHRYLFHVYDSKRVSFPEAKSTTMVLNEDTFAKIRASIIEKLGDKIKTMISEVKMSK